MPRFSDWIKGTVLRRTSVEPTDLVALVTEEPKGAAIEVGNLLAGYIQGVVLTQAEYDALPVKDPLTWYAIIG